MPDDAGSPVTTSRGVDASPLRELGPAALGRGIILGPGMAVPAFCADWPRVTVDDDALATPESVANELHRLWLDRTPLVVHLEADPTELRSPETTAAEPWTLDPGFEFARERLQFLVWMNNVDCREPGPVWWWTRKAERLGATSGGAGDVVLRDGTDAFIDGGPRAPIDNAALGGVALVHRESIDLGKLTVARFSPPAAELAPDQLEAVAHAVGPARIIAPAGSGKTRVLTERLRHLLVDRGWEPATVMAVAYNRRAANEMTERTEGLDADIRTLNSLGYAICNGTAGFAKPIDRPRLAVIEEPRVREVLEGLVKVQHAPNTDPYVPYLEGLRAIRLGLVDPDVAEETCDAPGLAAMFPRFVEELAHRAEVDFDGQLYEAVRILLRDPAARRTAQARVRRLLVDEFQDLTPVHLLLLRLLSAPAFDVFGVGDDDQVIYGFSGASPEFLLRFGEYFPGATPHALEVNYRCSPSVVDAARNVLGYNTRRIDKDIRAAPGRAPRVDELVVTSVAAVDEAATAATVLERWHADGHAYTSMAALARVNSALLPLQLTLAERNVPGARPLDTAILKRTGIRSALAYMRIGLSPNAIDAADITETIRRPSRRIARNVVQMLTRSRRSSIADIERLAQRLSGGDVDKLLAYANDLRLVVAATASGDAAKVLEVIGDDVGLGSAMESLDSARREADRSTHGDDLAALAQAAALHPDPATFESWLRDVLSRPSSGPGVELSTIHRVKGQEWDHVIVFGATDDLLPHRLSSDVDEERRLFHVALTRGRDSVVVLADAAKPSPFLAELDGSRAHQPVRMPTPKATSRPGTKSSPSASSAARRSRVAEAAANADPVVVEALKRWRLDVAKADGVPAFVVLSDAHLVGIADELPTTLDELAACRGIGPTKLERYGDEILATLDALP